MAGNAFLNATIITATIPAITPNLTAVRAVVQIIVWYPRIGKQKNYEYSRHIIPAPGQTKLTNAKS